MRAFLLAGGFTEFFGWPNFYLAYPLLFWAIDFFLDRSLSEVREISFYWDKDGLCTELALPFVTGAGPDFSTGF